MNTKIIGYLIVMSCLMIFGCSDGNKGLEVKLLNKELYAYCPEKDCKSINHKFLDENYEFSSNNLIKFSITNHDNFSYVFLPHVNNHLNYEYPFKKSFSNKVINLDLGNFIFRDSSENVVEGYHISSHGRKIAYEYQKFMDSIVDSYYDNLGYSGKSPKWRFINSQYSNRALIIHPKEILFFETVINLPINGSIANADLERVLLNRKQNYKVQLRFKPEVKKIENWLTESQSRSFKENNYQFYNKELISSNEVDLIFKE